MTDTAQADALRALIEAFEVNDLRSVSAKHIHDAFGLHYQNRFWQAYQSGSLDAAKALHEALLTGWACTLVMTYPLASAAVFQITENGSHTIGKHRVVEAHNDIPARAWLLAVLKAKLAEVTG